MPFSFESFSGNAKRLMETVKISLVIGLGGTGFFFFLREPKAVLYCYILLWVSATVIARLHFYPRAENSLQHQAKLRARELLRQRKR